MQHRESNFVRHRFASLTIVVALAGCVGSNLISAAGTDRSTDASTNDASSNDAGPDVDDVAAMMDAARDGMDASSRPDVPASIDAFTTDLGRDVATSTADSGFRDVRSSDVASMRDTLGVEDVSRRDVQCPPSGACVATCDERRTRCTTCVGPCEANCRMTETSCEASCRAEHTRCMGLYCPDVDRCLAYCQTLPVNERNACMLRCGRCGEACQFPFDRCLSECRVEEMFCLTRCSITCDAAETLAGCALNHAYCVQICPTTDC